MLFLEGGVLNFFAFAFIFLESPSNHFLCDLRNDYSEEFLFSFTGQLRKSLVCGRKKLTTLRADGFFVLARGVDLKLAVLVLRKTYFCYCVVK